MANIDILHAIDEEDLGSVRKWLNSNTGRANVNKILNSGETVLNAALKVEANYTAPNTFAAKIVNLLKTHGARTAQEVQASKAPPSLNIFSEYTSEIPNIFSTPVASQAQSNIFTAKPPLAPPKSANQSSRKVNGIAFGPRRNKRNSRKRRATRRSRRN